MQHLLFGEAKRNGPRSVHLSLPLNQKKEKKKLQRNSMEGRTSTRQLNEHSYSNMMQLQLAVLPSSPIHFEQIHFSTRHLWERSLFFPFFFFSFGAPATLLYLSGEFLLAYTGDFIHRSANSDISPLACTGDQIFSQ